MQEALYYRLEKDNFHCELCPQACRLYREGQEGFCGVRFIRGKKLVAGNYAICGAIAVDPIEKKPLYHFYPGWEILSLGTTGCNLNCSFCQNWRLAHGERIEGLQEILPPKVLEKLRRLPSRQQLGIAFTYNEPTVWYEYVLDTARLAAAEGYKNILVTNGMINPAPLEELLPVVHGMNIDIKAFNDDFYRRFCRGKGLKTILRTAEQALKSCHVELTYLIITTLNDSMEEISAFVDWVASLDKEIPVHFSRYFPSYKMDTPPTPVDTMRQAWKLAREKLPYVYLGNVMDTERSSTYCPCCRSLLLGRKGYHLENYGILKNKCTFCGYTIRLTGHIYSRE